jgi:Transposase IS66 family
MKMELPEIRPEERTPLVEALLAIIQKVLDRNSQLEETVLQLRDEIAILKGQKPRPQIKPSRLEAASPPSQPDPSSTEGSTKRPGSEKRFKNSQLAIHRTVPLHIDDLPAGAVFARYEPYMVQDLVIENRNTLYLRARYKLADGHSILAPLPADVLPGKHFGTTLIGYVLHQHHNAGVTQGLLLQSLHDYGVDISEGEVSCLLTEGWDIFHQEKDEVREAGLQAAAYIGTDDTGARHQGRNGYCTVIGNNLFAYFESTDTKSRLNFLQVLHGKQRLYAINATMLAYCERQELAAALMEKLELADQQFTDESAWRAWLVTLGITSERHTRITTEGALLGGLVERGVSPEVVVLSDGAPQFDVFVHASCWIHAERPLARMVPYHDAHRAIIEKIREQIWELYKELKAYRQQPDTARKPLLEERFDGLCAQETGYPSIDGVLKEIRDHKSDLLRVLERPEVPLHNNAEESDIREYVKKRKISGGTRSVAGRRCRDTFTSLKKTCRKLGVNFWDYLRDRLRGLRKIAPLADLIRERATTSRAPLAQAVPV